MDAKLAEATRKRNELQQALREAEEEIDRIEETRQGKREELLNKLAYAVLDRLEDGVSLSNVTEGAELTREDIDQHGWGPNTRFNEVGIKFYAARERKGYVDTSDLVDHRNPAYRTDEVVVMQVIIPRDDVAIPLEEIAQISPQ